jgi:molybdopterin biosynthesis enzyme
LGVWNSNEYICYVVVVDAICNICFQGHVEDVRRQVNEAVQARHVSIPT